MDNNQNVLLGIIALLILGIGGYFVWKSSTPTDSGTATTTPSGSPSNTPGTTGPTTSTHTPSKPSISTNGDSIVSNSGAIVSATITPNGSQTTYWYEYGPTASLGSALPPQTIGSGYNAITAPAYIKTLVPNTTYYFRVVASNASGTVTGATYNLTTNSTPPPPGVAPAPKTDAATNITRTSVTLNGHVNPDGATTSYWFEFGTGTDLGDATAVQTINAGNNSTNVSVALTNLSPVTKYYYRVNAQNQFGTVNGSILNFTTTGPAAPLPPVATTNNATAITGTTAVFNGVVNPRGAASTYWFEYGTDALLTTVIGDTTPTDVAGTGTNNVSVSTKQTGLHSNTHYYVRVVSSNATGTVRGAIVNFKTN